MQKTGRRRTTWPTIRPIFEIEGNKFKPHPGRNPGQTSVACITHSMLAFGIGEDPFNGFLTQSVDLYAKVRLSQLLCQIQTLLPDMSGQDTLPLRVGATGLPAVPRRQNAYLTVAKCGIFSSRLYPRNHRCATFTSMSRWVYRSDGSPYRCSSSAILISTTGSIPGRPLSSQEYGRSRS